MTDLDMTPAVQRITKDLREAAKTLTEQEARYLVDYYYQMQEDRKRSANQDRAVQEGTDTEGPSGAVAWLASQGRSMEARVKTFLDIYSGHHPLGIWARANVGIGPVLAAGLLAHIDMKQAPTAGHIWSFSGLDSRVKWTAAAETGKELEACLGGRPDELTYEHIVKACAHFRRKPATIERYASPLTWATLVKAINRRPWNTPLKTLCVHPDCYITTLRGPARIKDVQVGDLVLTHENRWRPVTKVFENQHDGELYGLRSANAGNATAWLTAGHPVYAASVDTWESGRTFKPNEATRKDFDWHAVDCIEPRWNLLRPVVREIPGPLPTLQFEGIRDGDYVRAEGQYSGVAHPNATPVLAEIDIDLNLARLIGLYLAEGHISRTNVVWSFHEDETHLVEFVQIQIERLTGKRGYVTHNIPAHSVQVAVGCKPLADEFALLFGTGSMTIGFPHEWLERSTGLLSAMWSGIMDGDGDHVGKDAGQRISTANGRFARQLVDLGRRLGKSVSMHSEHTGRAFRVHVNQRADTTPGARETLREVYSGPVFNLEVEEDHSYVVEGYAVHNCWKIGESFVKVSGKPDAFYGKLYVEYRAEEDQRNELGEYAQQAEDKLKKFKIGKTTDAYAEYSQGRLPKAHLFARAKRRVVKMFLSHYHHVGYLLLHDEDPPRPWAISHGGHSHFIVPPHLDVLKPRDSKPNSGE